MRLNIPPIDMKIHTDPKGLYKSINCLETNCLYRASCANHTSAGDYRSEDGFRPELYLQDGEVYCKTTDTLPIPNLKEYLPETHMSLQCGMVLWDDLADQVENWAI